MHWIEAFVGLNKSLQLDEVKRLIRLQMSPSGRLAELNVGVTGRHVGRALYELRFVHSPLTAEDQHEADPSHSEIEGLPPADSPQVEMVGDLIAETVQFAHPTTRDTD